RWCRRVTRTRASPARRPWPAQPLLPIQEKQPTCPCRDLPACSRILRFCRLTSSLGIAGRLKAKHARNIGLVFGIVGRVPASIVDKYLTKIERRYAFEARDVDAELIRVRAALVVRV